MNQPLKIFCNAKFPDSTTKILREGIAPHQLIMSKQAQASNLVAGGADPGMNDATAVFGQPDPKQVLSLPNIKWIHLTSAGYTRYDTPEFRNAMKQRNAILTTSSGVFSEPCAQHVLAFMLAHARQLPLSIVNQAQSRAWPYQSLRNQSSLLKNQNVLIFGYGSIARRLCELLKPFDLNVTAVRRSPRGDEGVAVITPEQSDAALGQADHVINILPASSATDLYFNKDRFAKLRKGAIYYNIGRGASNDQVALRHALETGALGAAYLDVTTPEPLPENDPLWKAPNCYITPHTAGGHHDEFDRNVRHFLDNLKRFESSRELLDRVI